MPASQHPGDMDGPFVLVKTAEFGGVVGDDSFNLRIEIFQDMDDQRTFRASIWRTEFFRMQSTFPQDESTGMPRHQPSDEVILVDWSSNVTGDYSRFDARTPDEALTAVVNDIRTALVHAGGRQRIESLLERLSVVNYQFHAVGRLTP